MVADPVRREILGPTGRMRITVRRRGIFGLRWTLERETRVRYQRMNPYAPQATPVLEWIGASAECAADATFLFEPTGAPTTPPGG